MRANAVWRMTIGLFVLTSLYMPVSRFAMTILVCSPDTVIAYSNYPFVEGGKCTDAAKFFAGFLLVTFTIPLPLVLCYAISKNKPRGSMENENVTFDQDGNEVDRYFLDPDCVGRSGLVVLLLFTQTSEGPVSAVSKQTFAIEDFFSIIFQDLQD